MPAPNPGPARRVLVVEDDPALSVLLRYNLEQRGYAVEDAGDGAQALALLRRAPPDAVVLDWMLPGLSGVEICRAMRRHPRLRAVPVLMLTARAADEDAVQALDAGADDHLAKPFSIETLAARLRALLRRGPAPDPEAMAHAGIALDPATRAATRDGRALRLGPTEYRLLATLLRRPGRVFSRAELLAAVWGEGLHVEPRTVDVHVLRLRRALNRPGEADPLRTIRGVGYALGEAGR